MGKEFIVETVRTVVGHLTDLEDHEDLYVNNIIEALDINSKIKVISSIINPDSYIYKTVDVNKQELIKICMKNLSDIIKKNGFILGEKVSITKT